MKRIILALAVWFGLMGVLWLALPPSSAADAACRETHIVKRGETRAQIAVRYEITEQALVKANPSLAIGHFFAGQELCIPADSTGEEEELGPQERYFALMAEYKFNTNASGGDMTASGWTLGRDGRAGVRRSYLLKTPIKSYTDTIDVLVDSVKGSPRFWLSRNTDSPDATDYILVVIGDPTPLLDLQLELTPTQRISDIIPVDVQCQGTVPAHELSVSDAASVTLQAELLGADGVFIPVDISQITYCPDLRRVASVALFQEVGFALNDALGVSGDGYEILMVLNEDGAGPPGTQWTVRCTSWKGGGFWSRWLRGWFGCKR